MKESHDKMSFWDHLEEFRWTLIRSVLALLVFFVVLFIAMPYIYDTVILGPTKGNFFLYQYLCKLSQLVPFFPDFCLDDFQFKIININLASQFFRHVTTSLWLALIFAFPYLALELWRFVKPALYVQEKNSIKKVFFFGTIMFFIGCAAGYSFVFPITFQFLANYQLSVAIENQISLDSYMDNFLMLIFVMGVVFELPILSWLLSKLGLIDKSFFSAYRRHAIVVLLVLSAIITPSGDPFTLSVVFVPLYLLYEISSFCVDTKKPEDELESEEVETTYFEDSDLEQD